MAEGTSYAALESLAVTGVGKGYDGNVALRDGSFRVERGRAVRRLAGLGTIIIYISHRLEEIFEIRPYRNRERSVPLMHARVEGLASVITVGLSGTSEVAEYARRRGLPAHHVFGGDGRSF